jgi:hypothetical protein
VSGTVPNSKDWPTIKTSKVLISLVTRLVIGLNSTLEHQPTPSRTRIAVAQIGVIQAQVLKFSMQ